jgi:uncharacterized protein YjbI with pentapeptide repeats
LVRPNSSGASGRAAPCAASCVSADLSGADLTGASAIDTDFSGANLAGANLTLADFDGANLTDANVAQTSMNSLTFSPSTIFAGIRSGGINGQPTALFNDYVLLSGYIVGPGVNLSGANLKSMDFGCTYTVTSTGQPWGTCINLSGADLSNANLQYASFQGAILTGTNMQGVNFPNAYFRDMNLSGVNFAGANLVGADLRGNTKLTNANFTGANLTGMVGYGVIGEGCPVWTGANFSWANLTNINVGGPWPEPVTGSGPTPCANLTSVNFTGANMTGAFLQGLNMTGSTLVEANLQNSNMGYVTLGNVQAAGASFYLSQGWTVIKITGGNTWNQKTICPNGGTPGDGTPLCQGQTLGW